MRQDPPPPTFYMHALLMIFLVLGISFPFPFLPATLTLAQEAGCVCARVNGKDHLLLLDVYAKAEHCGEHCEPPWDTGLWAGP